MTYVIGVDGGTESLPAFVFDLEGRQRGSHVTAYKTDLPQPSWAEQDPEDWWQALGASVKAALAKANVAAQEVLALCVDTTCCSVVTLERDVRPTTAGGRYRSSGRSYLRTSSRNGRWR
jgi:ribulose kinase